MLSKIKNEIEASTNIKRKSLENKALLEQLIIRTEKSVNCLCADNKIVFAENGLSLIDIQHSAVEFAYQCCKVRAPLPSLVLDANASLATTLSNGYSDDRIFDRVLEDLVSKDDLFIAISTNDNRNNIINAVHTMGIATYALTGSMGVNMHKLCKCIPAPSEITVRTQEYHISYEHIIEEALSLKVPNNV